jgi:hypothetical protein
MTADATAFSSFALFTSHPWRGTCLQGKLWGNVALLIPLFASCLLSRPRPIRPELADLIALISMAYRDGGYIAK